MFKLLAVGAVALFFLGIAIAVAVTDRRQRKRESLAASLADAAYLALPLVTLSAIGFWIAPNDARTTPMPNPRDRVDALVDGDHAQLVQYLRSGKRAMQWMGHSWCRFECGIARSSMGSKDLSDGTWLWPEGLAHYVEQHSVRLPRRFIEHARAANFVVPELSSAIANGKVRIEYDFAEWLNDTAGGERG